MGKGGREWSKEFAPRDGHTIKCELLVINWAMEGWNFILVNLKMGN